MSGFLGKIECMWSGEDGKAEEFRELLKSYTTRRCVVLLDLAAIKTIVEKTEREVMEGRYKKAITISRQLSVDRISEILTRCGEEAASFFLREAGRDRAGSILAKMPPEFAHGVLYFLDDMHKARLLAGVPPDDLSEILDTFSDNERQKLVSGLDRRAREHIEKSGRFSRDSAGRMMSPFFLTVRSGQTVKETIEAIMSASPDAEKTPYIYVVNEKNRPTGVVSVKDLLRAEAEKKVGDIMAPDLIVAGVHDSAHDAAITIRMRRLMMLPVVDEGGEISGVITFDDAMKVLSEDAASLLAGLAGTCEESFFTPPLRSVKSRLPWMVINVFLNMAAVAVITGFEQTIATVAILAAFIPMITDMGGNVGIQSLSVAIRSIALGEARIRDIGKAVRKETRIGIFQGAALGGLFALIAFVLRGNAYLGMVAGIALGANVLIAGIVGGTLPFIVKFFGKDPAMMTGPFLTTITDISGVSVYLGLATLFVSHM